MRTFKTLLQLWVPLLLWGACSSQQPISEPLSENLPMLTLRNFERDLPVSQRPGHVVQNVNRSTFFVVVRYSGRFQRISLQKFEFLDVRMNTENSLTPIFQRLGDSPSNISELLIKEDKQDFWVPIASDLIQKMSEELKPGDKFRAELQHYGSIYKQQVYVMVGYDRQNLSGPPRLKCFGRELLGAQLNAPFQATAEKLKEKFQGSAAYSENPELTEFVATLNYETQKILKISTIGPNGPSRVFTIRLSEKKPPQKPELIEPLFKEVGLGSRLDQVLKVFGEVLNEKRTKQSSVLTFKKWNPACTVEMTSGVVTALTLSEDPNYFSQ